MAFENVIVKIEDIRKVAFCSRGTRGFFQKHDMDWRLFLQSGLPAKAFLDTNDSMAYRVAEAAEIRMKEENGQK